jgi:xylulokinase
LIMREPAFIGVDVGTTSVKAGIFNSRRGFLCSAVSEFTMNTPAVDHMELDAETYWRAACRLTQEAHPPLDQTEREFSAITISSQSETAALVDKEENSLKPTFRRQSKPDEDYSAE